MDEAVLEQLKRIIFEVDNLVFDIYVEMDKNKEMSNEMMEI